MNLETVERIVALLNEYPVSEITVEQDGQRISVRKPLGLSPAPSAYAAPHASRAALEEALPALEEAPPAAEVDQDGPEAIVLTAPMVGIFHAAERPVRYEATVALGQVVGSIESMKLMNDIPAERAGRVVEIFVEDGAPVEYGQALFRLATP